MVPRGGCCQVAALNVEKGSRTWSRMVAVESEQSNGFSGAYFRTSQLDFQALPSELPE